VIHGDRFNCLPSVEGRLERGISKAALWMATQPVEAISMCHPAIRFAITAAQSHSTAPCDTRPRTVTGTDVVDRAIVGDGTFVSMKERGYL
jgi:hypothetical protein